MKNKPIIVILLLLIIAFVFGNCSKKRENLERSEGQDTTSIIHKWRGLVLDTRTTEGLYDVKVAVYGIINSDSSALIARTRTDSNGFFKLNYSWKSINAGFLYVFEHDNPIFLKRTFNAKYAIDKLNDSTDMFYLHRKPSCKITLMNMDGKQKNIMLFNTHQQFSKLLMALRSDTTFYYRLEDYNDVVNFDYFPQKQLQSLNVKGGTSGDTVAIEFKY